MVRVSPFSRQRAPQNFLAYEHLHSHLKRREGRWRRPGLCQVEKGFSSLNAQVALALPFCPRPTYHSPRGIDSTGQAKPVPWLLPTSLSRATGGASLLPLCLRPCPDLPLPHRPQ